MTEHLSDLLERVADGAPPPRGDLVTRSMRRGGRLRSRRDALRAVGATAAVAVVVLGASTVVGDRSRPRELPAAASTPSAAASSRTPPGPSPSRAAPVPTMLLPRAAHEAFADHGRLSALTSQADQEVGYAALSASLTDRTGASAAVSVAVTDAEDAGFPSSVLDGGPAPEHCQDVRDGGFRSFRCQEVDDVLVVSYVVRTDDTDPEDGALANVVEARFPSGLVTRVRSYNSPGHGAAQTLDEPLLDRARLRAVALDPVWQEVRLHR